MSTNEKGLIGSEESKDDAEESKKTSSTIEKLSEKASTSFQDTNQSTPAARPGILNTYPVLLLPAIVVTTPDGFDAKLAPIRIGTSMRQPAESHTKILASLLYTTDSKNDLGNIKTIELYPYTLNIPGASEAQNTSSSTMIENRLYCNVFFSEHHDKFFFFADNESDVSILPLTSCTSPEQKRQATKFVLRYPDTSLLITYGLKDQTLNLARGWKYRWRFIIADIPNAILGNDFLTFHNLYTDEHFGLLIDKIINSPIPVRYKSLLESEVAKQIKTIDGKTIYHEILKEFKEITRPPGFFQHIPHRTTHRIRTIEGAQISSNPPPLEDWDYFTAHDRFERMSNIGTVRPSNSKWQSPLDVTKNKLDNFSDGCYKKLNAITKPARAPVVHLHDIAYLLAGCTVFTMLDIMENYDHIPINPEDVYKTATVTLFGLYEFLFLRSGLRNASVTFQHYLQETVRGLKFCVAYLNTIIVFSQDENLHRYHVRQVFQRLKDYNLVINTVRCEFAVSNISFLGCNISANGAEIGNHEAIAEWTQPSNARQLRRFLGVINDYRRFLRNACEQQAPLLAILQTGVRGSCPVTLNEDALEAFETCKASLAQANILAYPDSVAPVTIVTKITSNTIKAALLQTINGEHKELGFFSKNMSMKQRNSSAVAKAHLVIYNAIVYFHKMLYGRKVTIFTDVEGLSSYFNKRFVLHKVPFTLLQQSDFVSNFQPRVRYSRYGSIPISPQTESLLVGSWISLMALIFEQTHDPELAYLIKTKNDIAQNTIPGLNLNIYCNIRKRQPLPYVPKPLRKSIFDHFHFLTHHGIDITYESLKQRFYWPRLKKDCRNWEKQCQICQSARNDTPIQDNELASLRFKEVYVTILGPLSESGTFNYLLLIIDCESNWPEAIPMLDNVYETTSETFLMGWVTRFGVPEVIFSKECEAIVFKTIAEDFYIMYKDDSEMSLRFKNVRTRMRSGILSVMAEAGNKWSGSMEWLMLGIRHSFKNDLKTTSSELLTGEPMRASQMCPVHKRFVMERWRNPPRSSRTDVNWGVPTSEKPQTIRTLPTLTET